MWAITAYFNPMKYARRLSNYRVFRANLALPLVAVELSFDNAFELNDDDADVVVRLSGGALLWQKERLLNVALRSLPTDASHVAWLDCDVMLTRTDWVAEAEARLRTHAVVQLFSELHDLDPDETAIPRRIDTAPPTGFGIVSLNATGRLRTADFAPRTTIHVRNGCFGLAWAARRSLLDAHGFYDAMIVGSGDRSMVCAMYGRFDDAVRSLDLNEKRRDHYLRWAMPYHADVRGRVGYVPGKLCHLWHGDVQHRGYLERHRRMSDFAFDPATDIMIAPNGAWDWASRRPELTGFLHTYFMSRREDGVLPQVSLADRGR
jgi:hypothetical protein